MSCRQDVGTLLSGVPRLLEALSDPKQNFITHTVRCATRNEDDALMEVVKMSVTEGLSQAISYAEEEWLDSSRHQWATW